MAVFDEAFQRTVGLEGGYTNDPDDAGGQTRYGITQAEARAAGYLGDMKDFPLTLAETIYRERYWRPLMGDALQSQAIAEKLFDAAVNCGVQTATRWLQRALNVLNRKATLWPDVIADGFMGPATVSTLTQAIRHAAQDDVLETVSLLQGAYYVEICERAERDETFYRGWLHNRVGLRTA